MPLMDDTQIDRLLTGLEAAEPADAPDMADELAAALEEELEGPPAVPEPTQPIPEDAP
jgi:hypothetical protein